MLKLHELLSGNTARHHRDTSFPSKERRERHGRTRVLACSAAARNSTHLMNRSSLTSASIVVHNVLWNCFYVTRIL